MVDRYDYSAYATLTGSNSSTLTTRNVLGSIPGEASFFPSLLFLSCRLLTVAIWFSEQVVTLIAATILKHRFGKF